MIQRLSIANVPSAVNQEIRPNKLEDKFWKSLYPAFLKKKKWERDMKVIQKAKAKEIYIEALSIGLTEHEAAHQTAIYLSSQDFLLPHIQKYQRLALMGDRASVRFLNTVPYLYTSTELRPFWDYVLKHIKKKKSEYSEIENDPKSSIRHKNYLNIVKKNTETFLTQYNRIMDVYRNAIMQTEFKLQLVIGSDAARLVLSYV